MKQETDGIQSIIRIGFDGRVHKHFVGDDKQTRFTNEVTILKTLAERGCNFVPRLISSDKSTLSFTTTNCGAPPPNFPKYRADELFSQIEDEFGVTFKERDPSHLTYDSHRGRFCVINFENAQIDERPGLERATHLHWAGKTVSGERKPQNEDSIAVYYCQQKSWQVGEMTGDQSITEPTLLFIVSDGMGGHAGGALASHIAITEQPRFLAAKLGDKNERPLSGAALMEASIQSLHNYTRQVSAAQPQVHDMGATLVSVLFSKSELQFGHVGDSRLYRFRESRLEQLTEDHSYVGALLRKGTIDEEESRLHPRRNVLTQAVGAGCPTIYPQKGEATVLKGDWFLMCSDGVIDGLWDHQIEQEFLMAEVADHSVETVADNLLKRAVESAGRDDTTLFVLRAL